MIIAPGSTDVITYFKLVDPATGVPETGLTIANLDATYVRDGAAAVKNGLSTPGGYTVSSVHADNAAIQVDATNAPGLYRVDWPDAAFAAGVNRVQLVVNGAAVDPAVIEVELALWLTAITGATVIAVLNATQGAITWAQQKIVANVANEGALDIRNANADGIGTYNNGGDVGLYNDGTALYGQYNVGADTGMYNNGTGAGGYGNYNAGVAIGQYNAGSGAASAGQTNQGIVDGQYNQGGTYGQQNTGESGQVNVGTAGDGIYASGTDHGIELGGTVSAISENVYAEFFTVDSGETLATAVPGSVVDEIAGGTTGTIFPAGAINFTYTVTDSVTTLPIEGVEVWFSTDNPAVNIVWKGDTDAFGVARDVLGNLPALDAGNYFVWRQKAGYTFADPDTEVVS
jgi:hypothetical protein